MSSRVTVSAVPDWETWQNVTVWIMSCSKKVVPELDEWHFAFSFCAKISPPDICHLVKEPNSNREKGKKGKKKKERRICSHVSAFWAENDQRWRPNADECRRSNNSECSCPEDNSNLSCFWLSCCLCPSLDDFVDRNTKKHARAHKKTSVVLHGLPSSRRLC